MPALARSRRLARLVAAWILLWFALLQAAALLKLPAVEPAAGHGQHAAHECDEEHPDHGGGHSAADHLAQCPGCLFSTAPPPQDFALSARSSAAPLGPLPPTPLAARAQGLAQPPARGPPAVS
ncbi:hypothetical protein [Ramlibacter alkalitolerans]|uniref:DUF2946 domain-containing protein n=1 Tax=Ramlibacter alkalitolerans TaxID=2039631 RepID=A0ABS1JS67_9BURK|nr:hypothetical protein [Ramlibacter alkalitolerans]MBL0427087.1 hypothetical protein [Ramlibacter alkalitolerans]